MPLCAFSVGLSKKFVEIFQKTPLGGFLSQLPVAQQEDLLQSYVKDFLLLNMKVTSWEELTVGVNNTDKSTSSPQPQWCQIQTLLELHGTLRAKPSASTMCLLEPNLVLI